MPKMHGPEDLLGASGSKSCGRCPDCKTVSSVKAAPSTEKRILLANGALATMPSEGTEESSLYNQVAEVQLMAGPRDPSTEPQA
jgi:hypothetical protein